ncbi:MdtC family multidrug transporter [Tatumella ptyseos ATCC 33301]|uniref:Multidrug resistance protein MdtC n=2 Tax=Tatumella ptyseos TaxID=82987 RepID=A0A085JHB0_9GAMM|nr:multidrug efflux RND transporter permease subunit MdtC [Tatumella ptyseos]KFD19856.1 MdtC family multidrug transporter [Tatumella ptyseos ATCC 33301]SQK75491.1 Multidrug transporter MdtC [Tatumella ptyseos]
MKALDLFIHRPVATLLFSLAIVLAGVLGFRLLPVAALPQVDFPAVVVSASMSGASAETMAASVATPLERSLGRISGISEMTSTSTLGTTRIILIFDLNRDINGAARDVQAALNAAQSLLPSGMSSRPTYRKANPSDAPVMILTLTSDTYSRGQLYDYATTRLAQTISQIDGVGDVTIGGGSLPAVRVDVNPQQLFSQGISLDKIRSQLSAANQRLPLGAIDDGEQRWQLATNDVLDDASHYRSVIVHYNNGAAVRLGDIATVTNDVQDIRNIGLSDGKPAILMMIRKTADANVISTVDRIRERLPVLRQEIPAAIQLSIAQDRSPTIRASLNEVEQSLIIAIALVILVVFLFLGSARATLIPAIVVPVSLIGSFSAMYLCGFSLNNLSLMALTIATGFVVDDAIVVLENIARHVEAGMKPFAAALRGIREVGFTVLAMSLSLVAVFLPLMFLGGLIGRFFNEFAITLSVAILISLVISLTLTPMMCARLLKLTPADTPRRRSWFQKGMDGIQTGYARSLRRVLRHPKTTLCVLLATVALTVGLFITLPKTFLPEQDTGRISGNIQADQSISFQAMRDKLADFMRIVSADPAVDNVTGFTGGMRTNSGSLYISLKPLAERKVSARQVIDRLRNALANEPGARLYLNPVQDIHTGGRSSNASYQYTLLSDDLQALRQWSPKILEAFRHLPQLTDVSSDQEDHGGELQLVYDRASMARLGINVAQANALLNDAFGQREISTIYRPMNQYKVVLEVDPRYLQNASALDQMYLINDQGQSIPLSRIAHWAPGNTPTAVNHQGLSAAATLSFNLPDGVALSQASSAIDQTMVRLGVPASIRGEFAGDAKLFRDSQSSQLWLIIGAIATVYIVTGMLYESYIHPVTILSTLPPAGVGALLALRLSGTPFSLIAMLGILLLIGIVKKNAIMLIDFALAAEREGRLSAREAIYQACLLRFRPILMTTLAALFGALPLVFTSGDGAELRQPLGIAIAGGLIISQLLTLYTTPVVFLFMDKLSKGRRPVTGEP